MSGVLVPDERFRLSELEIVIEGGLQTFVDVGLALGEIRDSRLYRETHATFEDYCLERWKFTGRRGRQLIAAAEIGTVVPVENEAQARELVPLLRDHGPEAVAEAWASCDGADRVTAAALKDTAEWTASLIDWRQKTGEQPLTLSDVRRLLSEPLCGIKFELPLDEDALRGTHSALVIERAGSLLLKTGKTPPMPPSFHLPGCEKRRRRSEIHEEGNRRNGFAIYVERRAGELLLIGDVLSGAKPIAWLRNWAGEAGADWSNDDLRLAARGHLYAAGFTA
jgi:hypothetical protein